MKNKKIPMRKCVVSKEMKPKKEMVRVVRSKEGELSLDPTGKKNGRGAYVSLDLDLVKQAKDKNILADIFDVQVSDKFYDELIDHVDYQIARNELLNEQ